MTFDELDEINRLRNNYEKALETYNGYTPYKGHYTVNIYNESLSLMQDYNLSKETTDSICKLVEKELKDRVLTAREDLEGNDVEVDKDGVE